MREGNKKRMKHADIGVERRAGLGVKGVAGHSGPALGIAWGLALAS